MDEVYLDNSATTAVCERAAKRAVKAMTECYGNPSSLHKKGIQAEAVLNEARERIAKKLHAEAKNIYFTSGGTEANNLALFGAAFARKRMGNKIVTTAIEHHSVLDSVKELEKSGFKAAFIEPDSFGNISEEKIYNAVDGDTVLVSIMAINNELGSVMPIRAAARAVKRSKAPALVHVDGVQAFCKADLNPIRDGIDLLSVSAHKIHGPKGCGALYVGNNVRILPHMFGGGQEKKLRPGTQAVPLIAAFGEAVEAYPHCYEHISSLNSYAREKLSHLGGVVFNSDENSSPYILNFSVPGIRSEIMLHFLEQKEIYVSSGSACAMGNPSHVLAAAGLSRPVADSALRISFSHENTPSDIDALVAAVSDGQNKLIRSK